MNISNELAMKVNKVLYLDKSKWHVALIAAFKEVSPQELVIAADKDDSILHELREVFIDENICSSYIKKELLNAAQLYPKVYNKLKLLMVFS